MQQETQEEQTSSPVVYTGRVIWFDSARGFGFASRRDSKVDIFCHYSNIKGMVGYRELKPDQRISFEIGSTEDGRPQAVNIYVIED